VFGVKRGVKKNFGRQSRGLFWDGARGLGAAVYVWDYRNLGFGLVV